MVRQVFILLSALAVFNHPVQAEPVSRFGPEFTFSSQTIRDEQKKSSEKENYPSGFLSSNP